jgi:hypothetical protein
MLVQNEIVENVDGTKSEFTYFNGQDIDVEAMLIDIYENHWDKVVTTYVIQGAVFELFSKKPEKVAVMDGYLTVDTGDWHIHLCVGKNRGNKASKENKQVLQEMRQVKRGAFVHQTNGTCTPESWSLRFWNGNDEQMVNIIFPNPYLTSELLPQRKNPDWSKLEMWKDMRKKYLGVVE